MEWKARLLDTKQFLSPQTRLLHMHLKHQIFDGGVVGRQYYWTLNMIILFNNSAFHTYKTIFVQNLTETCQILIIYTRKTFVFHEFEDEYLSFVKLFSNQLSCPPFPNISLSCTRFHEFILSNVQIWYIYKNDLDAVSSVAYLFFLSL